MSWNWLLILKKSRFFVSVVLKNEFGQHLSSDALIICIIQASLQVNKLYFYYVWALQCLVLLSTKVSRPEMVLKWLWFFDIRGPENLIVVSRASWVRTLNGISVGSAVLLCLCSWPDRWSGIRWLRSVFLSCQRCWWQLCRAFNCRILLGCLAANSHTY